jgi:hypothetical protein
MTPTNIWRPLFMRGLRYRLAGGSSLPRAPAILCDGAIPLQAVAVGRMCMGHLEARFGAVELDAASVFYAA